jgi:uncharacterized protein YndB with AHSA1/START domain
VHVRSDRRYEFAAAPDELWAAFTRLEDYRTWWPWLRRFEAGGFTAGECWRCTVQPPLPYVLRFDLTLLEVEPHSFVTASVSGDIAGDARLDVQATDAGSEVRLVSALSPANPVLRAIATMARPMVRFGHDWVLDNGLRQFSSRAL